MVNARVGLNQEVRAKGHLEPGLDLQRGQQALGMAHRVAHLGRKRGRWTAQQRRCRFEPAWPRKRKRRHGRAPLGWSC